MADHGEGKGKMPQTGLDIAEEGYAEGLAELKKSNPNIQEVIKSFKSALANAEFKALRGDEVKRQLLEIYNNIPALKPDDFSNDQWAPEGAEGIAPGYSQPFDPAFMSNVGNALPEAGFPPAMFGGYYQGQWPPVSPDQWYPGYQNPYLFSPQPFPMHSYGEASTSNNPILPNQAFSPTENIDLTRAYRFFDDSSVYQGLDREMMERLLNAEKPHGGPNFDVERGFLKKQNITDGRGLEKLVNSLLLDSNKGNDRNAIKQLDYLAGFFRRARTSESTDTAITEKIADFMSAEAVNNIGSLLSSKAKFMLHRAQIALQNGHYENTHLFGHAAVELVKPNSVQDFYRGFVYGTLISLPNCQWPIEYKLTAAEYGDKEAATGIHYGTPRLRYLSHNEIMKDRNIHPDLRLQSAVIALTESRRPIEQLHANAVIGELWNDQVKIQYDPQIKGAFDKNINEAKSELRAPKVRVQFARAAMNCAITPKERHAAVDAVSENSGKLGPYYLALAYLTTERDSEGKNWFNDLCFKEQINPMQFESSTYIHEIAIHPRSIESIVPPYDQAIQSQRPGWKDSSAQIPQTLRPGNRRVRRRARKV